MNRRWSWLPLAVAALLACTLSAPAGALPVNIVQHPDGTYSNVRTGQATDVNGNVLVNVATTQATLVDGVTPIFSSALAVAGSDSCAPTVQLSAYKRLSLLVTCERSHATTGNVHLAISVRYHVKGTVDSVSTFTLPAGMLYAMDDSLVTATATTRGYAPGSATTCNGDEFYAIIPWGVTSNTPSLMGRRIYPLMWNGAWLNFDYLSVRVRLLGAGGSTVVKVALVGSTS